jgi:hypothetical protein
MNLVTPPGRYDRAGGGAASAVPSSERARLELAVPLIVRVGERAPGKAAWRRLEKLSKFND